MTIDFGVKSPRDFDRHCVNIKTDNVNFTFRDPSYTGKHEGVRKDFDSTERPPSSSGEPGITDTR